MVRNEKREKIPVTLPFAPSGVCLLMLGLFVETLLLLKFFIMSIILTLFA